MSVVVPECDEVATAVMLVEQSSHCDDLQLDVTDESPGISMRRPSR